MCDVYSQICEQNPGIRDYNYIMKRTWKPESVDSLSEDEDFLPEDPDSFLDNEDGDCK